MRQRFTMVGDPFLNAAQQGKNQAWRYVLGIGLTLVCWQVVGVLPLAIVFIISLSMGIVSPETVANAQADTFLLSLPPLWSYIALNAMFWCFLGGLFITVRYIHKRRFLTLNSADATIHYRRFLAGFGVWFLLMAIASLVEYGLHPDRFSLTFIPSQWLVLLLTAPLLTLIQAGTEELFFRGYLLQGLGLLTRQPLVLLVISGILFAVPHFLNPEMATNFVLLALHYFLFGVVLTWITLKDNRLELATGMHVANNLFIVLIVNYQESALASPSLFQASGLNPEFSFISYIVAAAIFYYWFFGRSVRSS
jgi:uncharacterized protein